MQLSSLEGAGVIIEGTDLRLRIAVLAMGAALAVGVAACGDSDSSAGGGSGSTAAGSDSGDATSAAGPGDTEQQRLLAVVGEFGQALRDADGDKACAVMAEATRRDFTAYKTPPGTCAEGFRRLMQSDVREDPSPEITAVQIDGDKATVVAKRTPTAPTGAVAHFVKQGGDWKVKTWFLSTTPTNT